MTQALTLILWFLTSLHVHHQPCLPEGIIFTTQGQVDSFNIHYPGCQQIEGNVDITGPGINNLDSLYSITAIGGYLQITYVDSLKNLEGLKNLKTIGGTLLIYETGKLTTLSGLDSLNSVGGNLDLRFNDQLISLDGLDALRILDGNLDIEYNPVLRNIQALKQLEFTFHTFVALAFCPQLAICNLPNICSFLTNTTQFYIEQNDSGCASFLQLLKACDPTGICPASGVVLRTQADIAEFISLFPTCKEVQGSLIIQSFDNPIHDISALIQITSIEKELFIVNTALKDLHGLDSLQSIGTNLTIRENHHLKNLTGLSSLNKINGYLSVSENDSLVSLDGLGPIHPDSLSNLYLTNSKSLSICSHESICAYLSRGGTNVISANALGCGSSFQVSKSCNPDADCPPGSLRFYSQEELDEFAAIYPNCKDLNGFLQIGPSPGASAITSLTGLSGIQTISGSLEIIQNPSLKSLTGLDSLVQVGGQVSINSNDSLVNLTGLGALKSISDQLSIQFNEQLSSLNGLGQMNIDSMTFLNIQNNAVLSACTYPVICNYLTASDNADIRFNANGCANLSQVRAACGIYTCLETGVVLSSQEEVDHFPVNYPGCNRILGEVTIAGPDIENLDSLIQVEYITGSLSIFSNNVLTNLDGLSNLKSALYLDIESNPLMADLTGFSGLTALGGILLFNNPSLASLHGLEKLDYNTLSDIYIESNPNLSECEVSSICSFLNDSSKAGNAYFAFNKVGCSSTAQVKTACGTSTCPGGPLLLSTQAEVDLFTTTYKDCTILPGDLIIDGGDITHLDSLQGITAINGQLIIQNTRLKSLKGLGFVNPVLLTHLSIQNNDSLAVCEVRLVCDYLSDASNTYTISGNAPGCASFSAILTECAKTCFWDGLTLTTQAEVDSFPVNYGSCVQIPGFLSITGNGITRLDSLYHLKIIGGGLLINTTALTDLNGLENLETLGAGLSIRNCTSLTDISQLGALDSVGGSLRIENTQLSNLNGLNGIRYIPFTVIILNNPSLISLAGLSGLQQTGLAFNIQNNALLPDLTGLEALKTIGTGMSIQNNGQLKSLKGLSGLESVFTVLRIENNPLLDSLVGLSSLQSIGSELSIRNNAALKNILSLKKLTSLRRLTLSNNTLLSSLRGLENFAPSQLNNLIIQNSPNLSVCNVNSICNYLAITPARPATISGNATTCTSKESILASCASVFPVSLVSFRAKAVKGKSILNWQAASEQQLDYYMVEHGQDGIHFRVIGTQSPNGNSIPVKSYQWVHLAPPHGINYYRLKMVDQDGDFSYSDVVSLRTLGHLSVYPNPTQNRVYILGLEEGPARVLLKDIIGRVLFESTVSEGQAIDMGGVPGGIYLLAVESGHQSMVFRIIRE